MELFRGGRFGIEVGDITKLSVDAIVNSTNPTFSPGFGVDLAIHNAAGPELAQATARLGIAPFGEARATPGFALPARHVVHVVAPVWKDGQHGEDGLLAVAYRSALTVARDLGARTVAFPAISTGAYAYPIETATRIALETCAAFDREFPDAFDRLVFAPFTEADGEVYVRLAKATLGR